MQSLTIRPTQESDLRVITAIYNDAVAHTTATWVTQTSSLEERRVWWRMRVDAGFPTFSAIHDDTCIGYASYGPFRAGPGYSSTRELSVYVDGAHRGRGVASKLIEALEREARASDVHVLVGGIEADNAASHALHLKHGYTQVARMPQVGRKFDRWLDLVLMQKILD